MSALEETFAATMPDDMGYSYSGMSYQEKKAAQGVSLGGMFAISGVFAFLLLASLYESWSLPVSIVLSVPIAILGAVCTLWVAGMELDLYAEIGLIMLIGLAAKNAILVVEFAQDRLAEGIPLLQATLAGAEARLRPILMTSFAFILGCIPLALAGKTVEEAKEIIRNYFDMVDGKEYDPELLQEALVMRNVHKQANRIKCATIGWNAMKQMIEESEASHE